MLDSGINEKSALTSRLVLLDFSPPLRAISWNGVNHVLMALPLKFDGFIERRSDGNFLGYCAHRGKLHLSARY